MTDDLLAVLQSAGHARVIVTLQRKALRDLAGSDFGRHFAPPAPEVALSLARTSARLRGQRLATDNVAAPTFRVFPNLGLALGTTTLDKLAGLRADNRVDALSQSPELSLIRPVARNAARPSPKPTWGLQRLRVPEAWAAGYTGKGVIVGHLDTGVDGKHPALAGAIHAFAEFDLAGNLVVDAIARDSDEHGTHTAGTIAGRASRTRAIGVAPGCKLASALVIEGGDVVSRILGGMDWVIEQGARILSMSLGLRGYTTAFQAVVDALRAANVLPVIAVGNEFAGTSRSPGNYANVLSVGACDVGNRVADFSSSERFSRSDDPIVPDLVAPGVAVLSCVPGRKYMTMDGTSMAAPHVAGLAAVLGQAAPRATASDLEAAILASCRRPATMDPERCNMGVPDPIEALRRLGIALPAVVA